MNPEVFSVQHCESSAFGEVKFFSENIYNQDIHCDLSITNEGPKGQKGGLPILSHNPNCDCSSNAKL